MEKLGGVGELRAIVSHHRQEVLTEVMDLIEFGAGTTEVSEL